MRGEKPSTRSLNAPQVVGKSYPSLFSHQGPKLQWYANVWFISTSPLNICCPPKGADWTHFILQASLQKISVWSSVYGTTHTSISRCFWNFPLSKFLSKFWISLASAFQQSRKRYFDDLPVYPFVCKKAATRVRACKAEHVGWLPLIPSHLLLVLGSKKEAKPRRPLLKVTHMCHLGVTS